MFSAVFMATFAEGVDEGARQSFDGDVKAAAAAVSDASLAAPVLEPPMPGGDYFCEVGFPDETAYRDAKGKDTWQALYGLFENQDVVSRFEFGAYGEGGARRCRRKSGQGATAC